MIKFNKIVSFRNMSKITVKLKGNGLILTNSTTDISLENFRDFEKLYGVVVSKINLSKQKYFQIW